MDAVISEVWTALDAAVCGRKHLRRGVPCQDACVAGTSPRPYGIVCDGRGSASGSHFGAVSAVETLQETMRVYHRLLSWLLDGEEVPEDSQRLIELLVEQVYRVACMAQIKCVQQHGGKPADYEFTLLMYIGGSQRGLTLHIGDGAIVGEIKGQVEMLSAPSNGEFANQTRFVKYGKMQDIRVGWVDTRGLTGVGLFSDGTGEGLVESTTNRISPSLSTIWTGMRDGSFQQKNLLEFLTRTDWEPRVQDDRCLALLTRGGSPDADSAMDSTPAKVVSVLPTSNKTKVSCRTPDEEDIGATLPEKPSRAATAASAQSVKTTEGIYLLRALLAFHLGILLVLLLHLVLPDRETVDVPNTINFFGKPSGSPLPILEPYFKLTTEPQL